MRFELGEDGLERFGITLRFASQGDVEPGLHTPDARVGGGEQDGRRGLW